MIAALENGSTAKCAAGRSNACCGVSPTNKSFTVIVVTDLLPVLNVFIKIVVFIVAG
jgi:hypothetical protein